MSTKNISELISTFKHLRLALEHEGKDLANFAKSQFMDLKGPAIGFDRGDDFFSLFRVYTNQYWVIVLVNDDGSIGGTASITRFKSKLGSEEKWIGYFSDLRIDKNASAGARLEWRGAYSAIVAHMEDSAAEEHCDHLVMAVFDENVKAVHVFKTGIKSVVHHELCRYWNLSVLHTFGQPVRKLKIRETTLHTLKDLKYPSLFLKRVSAKSSDVPLEALENADTVILQSIFGDAGHTRAFKMTNIPLGQSLIFWILSLLSPLRYSEKAPWKIKFLSNLSWCPSTSLDIRRRALLSMIHYSFRRSPRDFHILNITLMEGELCKQLSHDLPISRITAGRLFEVTSSGGKSALQGTDVVFEGAYL